MLGKKDTCPECGACKKNVEIDHSQIHNIISNAKKNAKEFFDDAELLESKKSYGHAYALLVFSLEEISKAQICRQYESFNHNRRRNERIAMKYKQPESKLIIDENKLKEVFYAHHSKRITTLTQVIFELTNTFDTEKKRSVTRSLVEADISLSPEVENIIRIFKKMHHLRERALYVDSKGNSPVGEVGFNKSDYKELKKITKQMLDRIDIFVAFRDHDFSRIEKNVKKMLHQYNIKNEERK